MLKLKELASGLSYLSLGLVNVYFIGEPEGPWILVDSGLSASRQLLLSAAKSRFGGRAPEFILLTHGHFDHTGGARKLASHWQIPVYAHTQEIPYISGTLPYPAADPSVGGFLAFTSRFMGTQFIDLGNCIKSLPSHGSIPGFPDWKWLHTPGHTRGHVAFYREADRALIAGDAFTTVNTDALIPTMLGRQEISRPGTPITINWQRAKDSFQRLAALKPLIVACGHGKPMTGLQVPELMQAYAKNFPIPVSGKYVANPIPMEWEDEDE